MLILNTALTSIAYIINNSTVCFLSVIMLTDIYKSVLSNTECSKTVIPNQYAPIPSNAQLWINALSRRCIHYTYVFKN